MGDWTEGPWFAVNVGTDDEPMMMVKAARIAGRPPGHEVAIVATGDSPQPMENANARLIAAAPDLYEALRGILDDDDATTSLADQRARWDARMDAARAALSKAQGGGQPHE